MYSITGAGAAQVTTGAGSTYSTIGDAAVAAQVAAGEAVAA